MYKTNKKIIISICIFIMVILFSKSVQAASATISANKTEANVGDEITITTTIKGAAWQINLSGAVSESYADNTDDAEDTTLTKKVSFKPTKADTYTVSMSGNVTGSTDSKSTPVSGTVKITVKDKEETPKITETENNTSSKETQNTSQESGNTSANTNNTAEENNKNTSTESNSGSTNNTQAETKKSSNANLSDLGIRPNDFKGFKPNITSYDVTVPNDVEKIEVYSKTQDDKAKVSVKGNRNLEVGKNEFEITVKAEDGTTKVYTINVTRQEAEQKEETKSETDKNTTSEENQTANETAQTTATEMVISDLKKLEIVGYSITPTFNENVYEYKLEIPQDVSSLEVKTEAGNENVQIDVAGNKDLKDGENVVTVVVTNKETKKTSTYQIIVNKKAAQNPHADAINEAMNKRNLIIKIGIGIIIVLVILCIIVFKKGNDEVDEFVEEKPKRMKEKHFKEDVRKDEEKSNEDFKQLLENKRSRKEISDEEKNARENVKHTLNNEDLPKGLQREKSQEFSMMNANKVQRTRDEEFDEKLERIRRERNNERKGGKHF